ncbi:MAG TPA: OPT/YSL family transporter, partial [Allosphingosinicella sp.]
LGGDLNWTMIGYGALSGAGLIMLDEMLGRAKTLRLPPLAVGIGIYLPMAAVLPVVVGAVIGFFYDRWADRTGRPEFARRMGVLTATGLIVGESLWGVVFAGIVAGSDSDTALVLVGEGFEPFALAGGTILFVLLSVALYRRTMVLVRRSAATGARPG